MSNRIVWTGPALAVLVWGSLAAAAPVPVSAADSPLAVIPATVPVVIHVRGIDRVKDRLGAMLKNAAPEFAPVLIGMLESTIENGINGRKLKGVPKDGSVFLVLTELPSPGSGEAPKLSVIARVNKYAEFRDGILTDEEKKALKADGAGFERAEIEGEPAYFVDLKDFAVMTPSKDAAQAFAKKFESISGKLNANVLEQVTGNDVAVYVNLAAVNKEFGDQIKGGRDFLMSMVENQPGDKAQIEAAKQVYAGMFQAIEDGKSFVMSMDFKPEGMNWKLAARVGSDTMSNKFLKNQKPASMDELGKLPAGQMMYSAAQFDADSMKSMVGMMLGTPGDGDSSKHKAAVEKLFAAGMGGSFGTVNFPASGLTVQRFSDPVKGAQAMTNMMESFNDGGSFGGQPLKSRPVVKADAESHKGFKFTHIKLQLDFDKIAEQIPGGGGDGFKVAMKKLVPETMNIWQGTDGKQFVQITANDWPAAKKMLDAFLDGSAPLGSDAAFQATRKQLPAKTSMLMLMDSGPTITAMGDYTLSLLKVMPLPIPPLPDNMKQVKTKTAFLGTAVTLEPEQGSFEIYIPAAGVAEIKKVVMATFMGGA